MNICSFTLSLLIKLSSSIGCSYCSAASTFEKSISLKEISAECRSDHEQCDDRERDRERSVEGRLLQGGSKLRREELDEFNENEQVEEGKQPHSATFVGLGDQHCTSCRARMPMRMASVG